MNRINMLSELMPRQLLLVISFAMTLLVFSDSSFSSESTDSNSNNVFLTKEFTYQVWLDETIKASNKLIIESRINALKEVDGFSEDQFSVIPEKAVKTDDWLGVEVHIVMYSGQKLNKEKGIALYKITVLGEESDTIKAICKQYIERMKNDEYYHRMIYKVPSGEIIKTLTIDHNKCKRSK